MSPPKDVVKMIKDLEIQVKELTKKAKKYRGKMREAEEW